MVCPAVRARYLKCLVHTQDRPHGKYSKDRDELPLAQCMYIHSCFVALLRGNPSSRSWQGTRSIQLTMYVHAHDITALRLAKQPSNNPGAQNLPRTPARLHQTRTRTSTRNCPSHWPGRRSFPPPPLRCPYRAIPLANSCAVWGWMPFRCDARLCEEDLPSFSLHMYGRCGVNPFFPPFAILSAYYIRTYRSSCFLHT
jgi:hypothetical protein